MADEKKQEDPTRKEEEELSQLLDSALKDFAPPKNTDDELDALMDGMDQTAAQKAACDFQQMLEQMVQAQEEALNKEGEAGPVGEDEEMKAMVAAMKQLADFSGAVANASSEDEFFKSLEALRSPESPMEPFMAMVMQAFASKDVMYPPLKELHAAYPKYLEDNKDTLSPTDKERYEKQYDVLGRICAEYEKQPEAASAPPETAGGSEEPAPPMAAFEDLGKLLVELQSHGYPPVELTGNLPTGFGLDPSSGMPRVEDPNAAAESCSIM